MLINHHPKGRQSWPFQQSPNHDISKSPDWNRSLVKGFLVFKSPAHYAYAPISNILNNSNGVTDIQNHSHKFPFPMKFGNIV